MSTHAASLTGELWIPSTNFPTYFKIEYTRKRTLLSARREHLLLITYFTYSIIPLFLDWSRPVLHIKRHGNWPDSRGLVAGEDGEPVDVQDDDEEVFNGEEDQHLVYDIKV